MRDFMMFILFLKYGGFNWTIILSSIEFFLLNYNIIYPVRMKRTHHNTTIVSFVLVLNYLSIQSK